MTKRHNVLAGTAAVILMLPGAGPTLTAGPPVKSSAISGFVSPGKPGAEVTLTAAMRTPGYGKAKVAQRLDIELELTVPADTEALSLAVAPTDVLPLIDGGNAQFTQPQGVVRHVTSVVPQAEGRHYLNVSVSLRRHGETRMRSFTVPVPVGAQFGVTRAVTKGLVSRNRDGEAVVITRSR